jgi:signal transduction histidine kinase
MLSKEELRLINITRLVPVFVLVFSILAILLITEKNDQSFENNLKEMEEKSILERKVLIKNEVYRVHDFINEERTLTVSKIKSNIKGRTNEAYSIIESIYINNQGKSQREIKRMVIDALRNIRFNDGRGYFFLYKTDGTVLMLPTLTHLEETNLWDVQDVKGSYIIRQVSNIATNEGEGFLTWWYNKPTENNAKKSFEKIGYVKHFKPYDWFVGTGEYIDDFESDLKVRLLSHINNISLNNSGYVFVIDDQENYMNDYLDEYIEIDRTDSTYADLLSVRENIIKIAQSGEGFISYKGGDQESTLVAAKKMSFVKGYSDWGWSIGTGIYLSELNETIRLRQKELVAENKNKRFQIILIGLLICIPVFILSLLLSNKIRSRFEDYKNKVQLKSNELRSLNKDLEKTVALRTIKLQDTIIDLKNTQDKLIETEKMASMIGLVTGVAHEMNTPFGVVITALSQTEESIAKFLGLLKDQELTKKDLVNFEQVLDISYELINRNMRKAVNLIDSFKSLSPQLQIEEKRTFLINEPIQHVLLTNKELLHKGCINVTLDIHEDKTITNYFHMISGAIHQLIQNSIIHAFEDVHNNQISISTDCNKDFITIEYRDNGQGIPLEHRERIFDPFYTTKRNTNCTGLGLSILYNRVVHQLKGEIHYDLAKSQGIKVIIKFPL